MNRLALSILTIFILVGLSSAQAQQETESRPAKESTAETVKRTAARVAGEVEDALEKTGKAVKETLGLTKTGCLIQGDEADPFILVENESGDRITVVGAAELPQHVGHTVKLHGSKESDGRVFHATKIEHIATSCDGSPGQSPLAGGPGTHAAQEPTAPSEPTVPRDRGTTAGDQGLNEADRQTTQSIRKAVTADETLSFYAKNVKIITRDGLVTLRGPVKTAEEKRNIEAKAAAVAGATNVNNELTVEPAGSGK